MNILDFLMGPLGWCPKFNMTGAGSVEDGYKGNRAILYTSAITAVSIFAFIIVLTVDSQKAGVYDGRVVQTVIAFLYTAGALSGNLARILWRVRSMYVSRSDWT
jgi:hypothetical protein